ncbi:MAG TPA: TVP38/TMEM64 family protein [Alphaproteobacteria bacterium]|nr:TVP38/TMEM64 family protein [Alphaproteobacteria bacterium]
MVSQKKSRLVATKWISVGLIVLSVFVIMAQLPVREIMDHVNGFIQGMGAPGMIVFGAVYVVATLLLVPGSAITLAAGLIFGLLRGVIIASIASTTGAALAFLIARYAARDRVAGVAEKHPRFGAVDRAIREGGWKIVGLLRLSPAIPFNLQNYLYGLTGIKFWPCVLTSWAAMLPGTFMYVYLGYLARAGVETAAGGGGTGVGMWVLRIAGFAATVAVTIYVTKLARRAINQQTRIDETPEQGEGEETATAVEQKSRWPAVVAAVLAVALAAFAVYAAVQPGVIRRPVLRVLSTWGAEEGK